MPSVAVLVPSSATSSPPSSDDVDTAKSSSPIVGPGPPLTDGFVDARFSSIYETVGFTGALILIANTLIWWLYKKQATLTYSTTESEFYAATEISKFIKWLCVLLIADIGLPYRTAIVVDEDNEAARQIGHTGNSHSQRPYYVMIYTAALQQDIASMKLALRRVGSSDNHSNHFTKLFLLVPFWTHTEAMMGAQHLTRRHLVVLGFDSVPCNCHLSSLFAVDLSSLKTASSP